MPFKIKAATRGRQWEVPVSIAGPNILDILQSQQIPIRSSCMGKGLCHQCRIQVKKGIAPIQPMERKAFPQSQLSAGWRLSCCQRPKTNLDLFFPQAYQFYNSFNKIRPPIGSWWLALDLGTTGVEFAAVDSEGVWAQLKTLNQQVMMGADVMTRLEYAQKKGAKKLQVRLNSQVKSAISEFLKNSEDSQFEGNIYCAGNSAVTSFFAGLDTENLGVSPYEPQTLDSVEFKVDDVSVVSLPLIHSFVGGDITAGLFSLWSDEKCMSKPWVFVDVGTNSEILFWDTEKLFVSSTPAGPAFEGSNISIGMRAENGAIVSPRLVDGVWQYEVIGGDTPKGVCGSSLVDIIAQSVQSGKVSEDGELLDQSVLCFTEDLCLHQGDIREFQLAKSAIRTGIDLVQNESSFEPSTLYLAGAFGEHLPIDQSFAIGLLPKIPVKILGNTSLKGCIEWAAASDQRRQSFLTWLNKYKVPVELALRQDFQDRFIENMDLALS